jgi:hypothetical protein
MPQHFVLQDLKACVLALQQLSYTVKLISEALGIYKNLIYIEFRLPIYPMDERSKTTV